MRSTFSGLNTMVRGLYANQISLDTVGHNITNANADGYSRQRVNLATTLPENFYGGNGREQIGTGADVDSITRARNTFYDQKMWKESSTLNYSNSTVSMLGQIEGIFSTSSTTGIQSVFNKFWDSWQTLSTNASDDGCRSTVRQRGVEVVDALQHAATQLRALNNDINSSIQIKADKANQILSELASLNPQIVSVEASGTAHANDLRDRRDLLVDQLSELINVRCTETKDGSYDIQSSGHLLLSGKTYTQLKTITNMDTTAAPENDFGLEKTYVYPEDSSQSIDFTDGEIKGLIDARDDATMGVDAYMQQLNKISKFFLKDFNELHKTGYDLNNAQGGNFFGSSAVNYSTDWPPTSAAPNAGTWLSQLKVNDELFTSTGKSLIAAKTLAQVTQSNSYGGRAILTGAYTATSNSTKYEVTVTGVDKDGKVTGVTCNLYNPTTSATATAGAVTANTDGSFTLPNGVTISINNDSLTKSGDTYTFIPVQGNGVGDNAVKIAEALKSGMRAKDIFGSSYVSTFEDASLDTYYSSLTGGLGVQSQNAQRLQSNQKTLVNQIKNWRESVSGINMDEEMTNMIRYQKGYSAAARVVTSMDEMLDKLINSTGTVGR